MAYGLKASSCPPLRDSRHVQTVVTSGVTRVGWVAHPWKVWREILEGRGKGGKKGREKEKEEEMEKRGKEGKEGKMERKSREIVKGEEENLKLEGGKSMKISRGLFFSFLFFFFFLLVTFWNHWNLFWVYHNGFFLEGGKFSNLANLWLHTWLRPWSLRVSRFLVPSASSDVCPDNNNLQFL